MSQISEGLTKCVADIIAPYAHCLDPKQASVEYLAELVAHIQDHIANSPLQAVRGNAPETPLAMSSERENPGEDSFQHHVVSLLGVMNAADEISEELQSLLNPGERLQLVALLKILTMRLDSCAVPVGNPCEEGKAPPDPRDWMHDAMVRVFGANSRSSRSDPASIVGAKLLELAGARIEPDEPNCANTPALKKSRLPALALDASASHKPSNDWKASTG